MQTNEPVLSLLTSIMELPLESRVRLAETWRSFDKDVWTSNDADIAPGIVSANEDEMYLVKVQDWIDGLENLAPRARLRALLGALREEENEDARELLTEKLDEVAKSSMSLTIEKAVYSYAQDNPILLTVGMLLILYAGFNYGVKGLKWIYTLI